MSWIYDFFWRLEYKKKKIGKTDRAIMYTEISLEVIKYFQFEDYVKLS